MCAHAHVELPVLPQEVSEVRRCGVGVLTVAKARQRVALPLRSVKASARVADRVAHVVLEQVFSNPLSEAMEAVYIFPLQAGAAVSDFELRVGKRVIKGKVDERQAARQQYAQALKQGKRAALLEQERDDVFTVSVGNIPPGEEIAVKLAWSAWLPVFEDGTTELRLPTVVAPRYIPGAPTSGAAGDGVVEDTTRVPDASRITPPRLAPGFDPRVGLGIEVLIADGEPADLACSQHATRFAAGKDGVRIALARQDELLNRDFVLRWRLAGGALRSTLLVHDGTGFLSLLPPKTEGFAGLPRDVVFVLDRSGSMEGVKMASASRACALLLRTLGPRDRFAIQAFDDSVEWYGKGIFHPADEAGLEAGEKHLRTIDARGGTELDGALDAALRAVTKREDGSGRLPVVVLLTDGQVGNESEILRRIQAEVGDARVFTIGIDTAVNEAFLRRLASLGGGTSTFVAPGDALDEALRGVGREIGAPVLVDVEVEDAGAGLDAASLSPARIPDLFAGRAAAAFFTVKKAGKIVVKGKLADGKPWKVTVQATKVELPALPQLWAKARVAELEDRYRLDESKREEIQAEIVKLAVAHRLLTRFTAFLAVDEAEIVNPAGDPRKVVQPVENPDRWDMVKNEMKKAPGGAGSAMGRSAAPMQQPEMDTCAELQAPPPPPAPCASRAPSKMKLSSLAGGFKDDEGAARPEPEGPSDAERQAVIDALKAYAEELSAVREKLASGKLPKGAKLESLRKALVKALGAGLLGALVARLARFVRTGGVELDAALAARGAEAVWLVPLFEKHARELEAAAREAEPVLAAAATGGAKKSWKFWERTV